MPSSSGGGDQHAYGEGSGANNGGGYQGVPGGDMLGTRRGDSNSQQQQGGGGRIVRPDEAVEEGSNTWHQPDPYNGVGITAGNGM